MAERQSREDVGRYEEAVSERGDGELESMWTIPRMYGKPFHLELSPTPEYRSVFIDVETGNGVAERWDGTVDDVTINA